MLVDAPAAEQRNSQSPQSDKPVVAAPIAEALNAPINKAESVSVSPTSKTKEAVAVGAATASSDAMDITHSQIEDDD